MFMRKVLKTVVTLCLAVSSFALHAQEETQEHMKFKQTEIKGHQAAFFSELKSKGFTFINPEQTQMTGVFAGQNVTVTLDKTCVSETIYQVRAKLKARTAWNDVESDYTVFKSNLSVKYGKPAVSVEKFDHPYRKGDGYEIKAANNNKMEYMSCWVLPEGQITIQVVTSGKDLSLQIRYTDGQGADLQEAEKTEQFLTDL